MHWNSRERLPFCLHVNNFCIYFFVHECFSEVYRCFSFIECLHLLKNSIELYACHYTIHTITLYVCRHTHTLTHTKIMHKVVKYKSHAYDCRSRSFQCSIVVLYAFFAYILYIFNFFFVIFLIVRVLLYCTKKAWHRHCHHSFVDVRANENYIRCIRVKRMCTKKHMVYKAKENRAKKNHMWKPTNDNFEWVNMREREGENSTQKKQTDGIGAVCLHQTGWINPWQQQ